jgi:hypothetical protein
MMTYGLIGIVKSPVVLGIVPLCPQPCPEASNSGPVLTHLRRTQTPVSTPKALQMADS